MDNDLERSVRLLEGALTTHRRSLLKPVTPKVSKEKGISHLFEGLDDDISVYSNTLTGIIGRGESVTGSVIRNVEPWKNTLDSLYEEFFEIQQGSASIQDVHKLTSEFARCCSDALKVITELKSKVSDTSSVDCDWLEVERSTWRLLFILYQDRLSSMKTDEMPQYFGHSEKSCMLQLFKRDTLLRESQIVVDWLEYTASEKDDDILHFPDTCVGWENTLHQLLSLDTIVFESTREIVRKLHPDAPIRENLPLHDLDVEDEKKLNRKIFREIRCGKLEDATKLCVNSGHAWRAALMQGWRLFHDPNVKCIESEARASPDSEGNVSIEELDGNVYAQVEGNVHRDVWKRMALRYCKNRSLDVYEKAAVAAYCGDLRAILQVCSDWEDSLWAYLKVMVDIRVESELRDCINRHFLDLPEIYWEQRMSLNEVFKRLRASENLKVQKEATNPERMIQEYIILDEISQLLEKLDSWLDESWVTTQFMRFSAHLVLFLNHIGQAPHTSTVEKIIEKYVKQLMERQETRLVAYYVGRLGLHRQVQLYASYLEHMVDMEERKEALRFAEDCDLNVYEITKQVVENVRNRPHDPIVCEDLQGTLTDADRFKISSLQWLLFYDCQRLEAVAQANALISTFLSLRKLEAAHLAFQQIPHDSVDRILSTGDASSEANRVIKEHLGYKAYLDAHEAFNAWFGQHSNKPVKPEELPENAPFTEKVAHQHRTSKYKAELERWKSTCEHYARVAKGKLYNVLLFPDGGWLSGADEMEYLRSICVPEVVLLLYSVLYESGLFGECVQLADVLASKKHQLYKVYSKEKLGEILTKLCESSVALLNEKKDLWGNEATM